MIRFNEISKEGFILNKTQWKELCESGFVLLDGATGSNLIKRGMPAGVCPEEWILAHPEVLMQLQKEYVEAGSNVVYAPTFTCNRVKLDEYGLADRQKEIIHNLVAISREAAGENGLVAGDITMTGQQLYPMGKMGHEELIDIYKEQIQYMVEAGVDLLVVETMLSLAECRCALIAAKEVCELPVLVTLTFEGDGRTLFGSDAQTVAVVLESLGADGIGVNCGAGPKTMVPVIEEMAKVCNIPLIAKPNAGLPKMGEDGKTVYDMDVADFVEEMKLLVQAGAAVLGGCCGTSPAYIAGLKKMLREERPVKHTVQEGIRYLASERKTVAFGLDDPFIIVGERINPTGKKALQAELREGKLDMVLKFAEEQEAGGAAILDINMGMSGIDEKKMMLNVLAEVQGVTNLPLSLDSSHVDVLEATLRVYPGRALVNSVSYEKEKFEKLLPIVKKYGAMFILLPLSDEGLPKDLEEKKQIIDKIYERALELGMRKEDIVVDGLVTTVGANKMAALETIETIRYCKENGLATICGLSNISFGMPGRPYVNSAFLNLAIEAGLTMAIANPSQEQLVAQALATDVLLNKKGADLRYIEYANNMTPVQTVAGTAVAKPSVNNGILLPQGHKGILMEAVLKGNRKGIAELTKKAVSEGEDARTLLDEALLPAINKVGELFEKKKYFLPQLIASAEAMKGAIEILEPLLLQDAGGEESPVIVIATVEGDIHDIGKNLVALMLKNYGFTVIDLGKDVPSATIIQAAKEHNADIIALSALMTTTMQRMREVVELAKAEGVKARIMVGGAVITQDYADEIHADGYSEDAAGAVKVARKILGLFNS